MSMRSSETVMEMKLPQLVIAEMRYIQIVFAPDEGLQLRRHIRWRESSTTH